MDKNGAGCWVLARSIFESVLEFIRTFLVGILSVGPIPSHIAFIMDGNRRYEKTRNLSFGMGHRAGYSSLTNLMKYTFGIGVKYVTVYAFSIDNFKRPAEEVKSLMELLQEKIEKLGLPGSLAHQYELKVHFIGNLDLLNPSLLAVAENTAKATAHYDKGVFSICIAYTSTDEIFRAVNKSCKNVTNLVINKSDIEKSMCMAVAPDPDIIIRSSGETRLSNFLLWQSGKSLLYTTAALWPEVGLGHLVWAILEFQRHSYYLHKKMKQV